jgi:hypothetical protein
MNPPTDVAPETAFDVFGSDLPDEAFDEIFDTSWSRPRSMPAPKSNSQN